MAEQHIVIPYEPRPVQCAIHAALDEHRFVVLVAHRRMGKTVLAVNHLLKRALSDARDNGVYAYVAPFRNQAKAIAWEYLKQYTAPLPGRGINESELSVTLPGGARIRLFGADNSDALRGLYFDGVILDEVAQMRPEVWEEIIRPALADRKGWAVFIGTPKGINLFHRLYVHAQNNGPDWAALLYRVTDTASLDEAEVALLRAEMSENAWRQEFLCDFTASADDVLIAVDLALDATRRVPREADWKGLPLVIGVDVARFGPDATVFFRRAGLCAFPPQILRGLDNMAVADRLAACISAHHPAAVFIDAGQGQGVIDRVRQLGFSVTEVPFGSQALRPDRFVNRRSEMWFSLREWLRTGSLPDDARLVSELAAPTYDFDAAGKIRLEPKDAIQARLGFSPDLADALALTFAAPVALASAAPAKARTGYDVFSW